MLQGHTADHVNYLGLGGLKDWQLMGTIRHQDYTFVTNNRSDFLALHGLPLRANFGQGNTAPASGACPK